MHSSVESSVKIQSIEIMNSTDIQGDKYKLNSK